MNKFNSLLLCSILSLQVFADASSGLPKKACCVEEKADSPLPDQSIYQLDSTWKTDGGGEIDLVSLGKNPQVITMFFSSCVFACPILVNDMRKIEDSLPEELRGKVHFTLVSFDTVRDTPEALAAFRKKHNLADNWHLLTGKPEDILELGAVLGIKFKKAPNGDYAHSNILTLLSKEGVISFQQQGLNADPNAMVSAVRKVLN